jgi:hypothetical protein
MRSVRVRLRAAEFSAMMRAMGEWLDANQYLPTRYKYDHNEDAVLVTVDSRRKWRRRRSPRALTVSTNHPGKPRRPTATPRSPPKPPRP